MNLNGGLRNKMGTYGISWEEITEELIETLDNIEGDFSNDDVEKALYYLQGYSPTTNSNKSREKEWDNKLKRLEDRDV